jgi:polyphosphate kinase
MERNMDKRIELLFPIADPECRRGALAILDAGFSDNTNAWRMSADGGSARMTPASGEQALRSQQVLYAAAVEAVAW